MIRVFLSLLVIILVVILAYNNINAQTTDNFYIKENCIGNVCIGDNLKTIKEKYQDYVIKPNEDHTGYDIFDNSGNFLIEFSSKKSKNNEKKPIRYIMTSSSKFKIMPGDIRLETKISDLIPKYGKPIYETGPNGYLITFANWPIKTSFVHDKYKINIIFGIYNPKLAEMFKYSGTINEDAEINMLKKYPAKTIINSVEIFADYYKDGKPIE